MAPTGPTGQDGPASPGSAPASIGGRLAVLYRSARARVHGWRRRSIADSDAKEASPHSEPPPESTDKPDPKHIMRIARGFMGSRLLQTAVSLGLFSALSKESMTAEELGSALGLHPRATRDFFDGLVAMKLLDREGNGPEGRYKNTPSTGTFLVKGSPQYAGGLICIEHDKSYAEWGDLMKALKTGQPQRQRTAPDTKTAFEDFGATEAKQASFLDCMDAMQAANFSMLANTFEFGAHASVADVGCGSALLSVTLAKCHERLTVTAFDLPPVTPHAERRAKAAGVGDRVVVRTGDFFEDDIPKADVVIMSQVLHSWSLERKMVLIRKAHAALPDHGAFIAIESTIDDARREKAFACMMSLHMMLLFGEGFGFTEADFRGWCADAGFRRFDSIHLSQSSCALVAYKN